MLGRECSWVERSQMSEEELRRHSEGEGFEAVTETFGRQWQDKMVP
jgi:hypothetical protein